MSVLNRKSRLQSSALSNGKYLSAQLIVLWRADRVTAPHGSHVSAFSWKDSWISRARKIICSQLLMLYNLVRKKVTYRMKALHMVGWPWSGMLLLIGNRSNGEGRLTDTGRRGKSKYSQTRALRYNAQLVICMRQALTKKHKNDNTVAFWTSSMEILVYGFHWFPNASLLHFLMYIYIYIYILGV